jgi:hypothetical protein
MYGDVRRMIAGFIKRETDDRHPPEDMFKLSIVSAFEI